MNGHVYRNNLNAVLSPCKNCQNRKEHCHSTCEVYLQFKKDVEDYKEKVKKMKGFSY